MKDTLYLIKCKENADNKTAVQMIVANVDDSYDKSEAKTYELKNKNLEHFTSQYIEERDDKEGIVAFICYKEREKGIEFTHLYVGEGVVQEGLKEIKYQMYVHLTDENVIRNLMDKVELDIKGDYQQRGYILISHLSELIKSFEDILLQSPRSQKIGLEEGEGRRYKIAKSEDRSDYQRDRERIVNCKAFRRLVDKAQIFSAQKGDHYRTRMTHTLEVNQIAKAIASALGLDLDLTEAIALAHDLGHTPFGHQGERTLQDILSGEIECIKFPISNKEPLKGCFGGFKHNYQGLRVLSKLEEKYVEHEGLNVSYAVMEGVLKHTKLKEYVNIKDFVDDITIQNLYLSTTETEKLSGKFICSTLEGQVVALSDEIAQRGHDVDDAISSGLITPEELIECLNIEKFERLRQALEKEKEAYDEYVRIYVDSKELVTARMVSAIVGYFITEAIEESRKRKDGEEGEKICLTPDAQKACEYLEKIISKRVISSTEVARFDHTGSKMIAALFKEYYHNPRLLHKGTLKRIYVDMLQHPDQNVRNSAIHIGESNIDIVNDEIDFIVNHEILMDGEEMDDKDKICFEKRKILVRNIVDFIAGMTDSYAMKEYKRLYP